MAYPFSLWERLNAALDAWQGMTVNEAIARVSAAATAEAENE